MWLMRLGWFSDGGLAGDPVWGGVDTFLSSFL